MVISFEFPILSIGVNPKEGEPLSKPLLPFFSDIDCVVGLGII